MSEVPAEEPLRRRRAHREGEEAEVEEPLRRRRSDGRQAEDRSDLAPRLWRPPRPAALAIALAFALLYGWDLVEAIAALAALLDFAGAAGHALNSYAWLVLGAGMAVPPIAFALALLVGRGRKPLVLAAVLAVGLAASAAVGLTIEALLRA